ncbi:hypothetical protein [Paracoccus sp. SSK6]|uniref:hypothetical protein n=1 Tax=Paracoccus sp. SSK6 TaxID=3143131 RepID=UPI00321B9960
MDYNDAFGAANPFEAVINQFSSMARDIARMRAFGPNPKAGMENAIQVLDKAAHLSPRDPRAGDTNTLQKAVGIGLQPEERVQAIGDKARARMALLTGEANRPGNAHWAAVMSGGRNLLRAAQLGRAVASMAADLPSIQMAAAAIDMNPNAPIKEFMKSAFTNMSARTARDLGVIMESHARASITTARTAGDIWQPEMTSRFSNFVLRANGMTAITNHEKGAVAIALGSDWADKAGLSFDQLPEGLRAFMRNRDFGSAEWDAIRAPEVTYTDYAGGKHLNPNWFRVKSKLPEAQADDIAIRFGALIEDHVEMSIPSFSLAGQSAVQFGTRPGTWGGEFVRSMGMYKGPMLSQMFNMLRRARDLKQAKYSIPLFIGGLVAMQTITGAFTIQLKEIWKGRDLRPMNTLSFWGAAMLQGGGLGILGDFLSSNTSRAGGGFTETVAGPAFGFIGDAGRAILPNAAALLNGEETHFGRDLVQFTRYNNPLASLTVGPAPVSLAFDRLFWDQFQYLVDPDAHKAWRRQERKRQREFGNSSWYPSGSLSPARAPDLTNILGDAR